MRHKIIVAGCLTVAFILGAISVRLWHQDSVRMRANNARVVAKEASQEQFRRDQDKANYKALNDECHKGQSAWDNIKVKVSSRPQCDLHVVQ